MSLNDVDNTKSLYNNKKINEKFLESMLYTSTDSILNKIDESIVIACSDSLDIITVTETLPKRTVNGHSHEGIISRRS